MLRSLVMRKIAALRPDLLKLLSADRSTDDKQAISGEWTQEARAIISVAEDAIAKDPALAAQLAEQAMPFGMVDWTIFLETLSQRDPRGAERLAATIINRMRGSSVHPGHIYDLRRFVLSSDRPAELRELFFQSLAFQLRFSIRPDTTPHDLEGYLYTARDTYALAAARYPHWQSEFADLVAFIEATFAERSLRVPGPPEVIYVDTSMINEATPDSTQEIAEALPRVEAITNSLARDREYQQLAAKAGFRADLSLAESIISKIENEEIRRETTVKVYTPMARKAIAESNWPYAQKLALYLQDPLGRSLMLNRTAQAMANAREDKARILDVYHLAFDKLQREEATQYVAKAFLILARSLLSIDPEAGAEAVNSAIAMLNKVAKKDAPLEEAPLSDVIRSLVPSPTIALNPEDEMLLPVLLERLFKDLARRNAEESVTIADGLSHQGLYWLARLTISKTSLEANGSRR